MHNAAVMRKVGCGGGLLLLLKLGFRGEQDGSLLGLGRGETGRVLLRQVLLLEAAKDVLHRVGELVLVVGHQVAL